ncbi:DNA methylase [Bosea sp. TND4EK4]|nr:DNA methylase [Bosea sp. TND4EK4]
MRSWTDLFAPRQLIGHCTAVEVFREILSEEEAHGLSDLTRTAFVYLALSLDKMLNYNSRMSVWMSTREIVANTFNRHDFAFCWSYAEMASLVDDLGYDWAVEQTTKCIGELVKLTGGGIEADLLSHVSSAARSRAEISITCGSGDNLTHVADASVDVVVMDPPYYDNVMYAELSDFFYVWLKRTAGQVLPQLFTRRLTDKENEAVANPAKFRDQKGAKALAGRDYQERMARIFEECRRVLKPNGVMTLMFTHKATGAWDALTSGLMQAGFTISASWPINTEAEGSLHIKDKSAANSTIFLVCRPRQARIESDASYWEDVEPLVASAVRKRVSEFQSGGIAGVDLYLASFGPALEELSKHWPLKRGTPRAEPASRKRRKQADIFDEVFDPYAVSPEDALEAARREVKTWRLNQLMHMRGKDDLDPATSWFVLAWDAFKAPVFAYDEGLRLARAVGADLDSLVGRLCEKKGSDLRMWDSATRAAKGSLGAADGSRGMIDVIHQVANQIRTRSVECPPSAPMAQI